MQLALGFYAFAVLCSLMNPRWGFICLLGSTLIRFQDRYPELLTFPAFILLLVAQLAGMVIHSNKLAKPDHPHDKIMIYMIFFTAFGLLIQEPGDMIGEVRHLISSMFFYYFATRCLRNKGDIVVLMFWLSVFTAYLGGEALYSMFTDPESPFFNVLIGRLQGIGYYANANEFGKLMANAIPFVIVVALYMKSFIMMLVGMATVGLMMVVIGFTLSRTCFVVIALMIFTVVIFWNGGNIVKKIILSGVLGFLMLVALSLTPGPLQERAQTIVAFNDDKSFQGRTRAWEQGFQMVSWYPIWGVGKAQWIKYHGRAPHNSYVQVLAENGLVGFYMWMMLVWLSIKPFLERFMTKPEDDEEEDAGTKVNVLKEDWQLKVVGMGVLASTIGYLFYILLGNQGYSPWTYFYFGLCAAWAHCAIERQEELEEEMAKQQPTEQSPSAPGRPRSPGFRDWRPTHA